LRDPEYGRRADHLRQRLAENPGRPLVVVLGSSRIGAGVSPAEWEAMRPGTATDPLFFNMAEVGGGPFIPLLTLPPAYADRLSPRRGGPGVLAAVHVLRAVARVPARDPGAAVPERPGARARILPRRRSGREDRDARPVQPALHAAAAAVDPGVPRVVPLAEPL